MKTTGVSIDEIAYANGEEGTLMRTCACKGEKGLKIGHNVFSYKMDELQQFL